MMKLSTSLIAVTLLCWSAAAMAQQAQVREVRRALQSAEKSLCKSLDLKKCRSIQTRKATARKKERPVAPPVPRERPNAVAAKPTPSVKPSAQKQLAVLSQKSAIQNSITESKRSVTPKPPIQKPAPGKTGSLLTTQPHAPTTPPKLLGCAETLAELGATFRPAAMPVSASKCNVQNPVKLTAVKTSSQTITFPDQPILSCKFASHFAGWARNVASPLLKATMQKTIVSISTGPGFDCRGRNGNASAKMSEHASGNAVDIETLKFADDTTLTIKSNGTPIKALRTSACEQFTTVLGPGSNSAHAEHLHFDMASRKGDYRICE